MPIQKSNTSERRTVASRYEISRWTSTAGKAALYQNLAAGADPEMMKSENLLFSPKLMVGDSATPYAASDFSLQRFQMETYKPLLMAGAGFLVFLYVMKYLTTK